MEVRTRKSIFELNGDEILALRRAFERIYSPTNDAQYGIYGRPACIHGGPANLINRAPPPGHTGWCPHHVPHFAPWHRIYIAAFEKDLGVTLPYLGWGDPDWKWDSTLPSLFSDQFYTDPNDPNNQKPNPLYSASSPVAQDGSGQTSRSINTRDIPQPHDDLQQILFGSNKWTDFVYLNEDEAFSNETKITLESPHDSFHGYIGGDMAYTNLASWDPVFWFHHCEVDRQFETWIQYFGVDHIQIDDDQKHVNVGQEFPDITEFTPYVKHTILDIFNAAKY